LFLAVLAYLFLFLPFLKFMVIARDHADERMARLERAAGLPPLSSPAPPSFVPWKFPKRGLLDSEEQK
jgi:hypothetical protein